MRHRQWDWEAGDVDGDIHYKPSLLIAARGLSWEGCRHSTEEHHITEERERDRTKERRQK